MSNNRTIRPTMRFCELTVMQLSLQLVREPLVTGHYVATTERRYKQGTSLNLYLSSRDSPCKGETAWVVQN